VGLHRCTATDAFVVTDLDGAPVADGVVRWAKKVLVDGARTLARSRTYAWALLGEQVSGASAGVNAAPDGRGEALSAFVAEVRPMVESGALALDPAKGVGAGDLAALAEVDGRSALRLEPRAHGTLADELLAEGAIAAAAAALGGFEGRTVAVEGGGTAGPALVAAVAAAGGRVVAVGTGAGTVAVDGVPPDELAAAWAAHGDALGDHVGTATADVAAVLAAPADVLCCGSRAGLVDHDVAADLPHRLVVPVGPVPVTARGMAVANRRGAVVLPDFLTTAGPLLAFRPAGDATADGLVAEARRRLAELTTAACAHTGSPFLGACGVAEDTLRTWRDQLPFGRPLA
jgi:hypothetical protein